MPPEHERTGSELFIVDNSDHDWKVLQYVRDWCGLSQSIDIATGFFEIGALLGLNDEWQKVDHIRILMGDEISQRTKRAFTASMAQVTARLDGSLESEKEKNDFLAGVPAIVAAIRAGKIECRVYRKAKFHAKAYITHARAAVIGAFSLVGSSNFTLPGLTENVELNVQITGRQVSALQEWYERYWNAAEDVTPDILRTIERHVREYSPFDVYAKALQEFFRGHEMTADEWELAGPERSGSRMYRVLDKYQQDGYHSLMKIGRQYGGAFLCDGVGLGKTFVGLMLIERLIYERKRVALFVPNAARTDVWEPALRHYLPHLSGDFSNLAIYSHTDLGRGKDFPRRFRQIKEMADVILIDEAHHFRNPGILGTAEESKPGALVGRQRRPSRYRQLFDLIEGPEGKAKQLFMLTATPINNRLHDFRHMVELFSRRQEDYFKSTIGINSLRGHFVRMERDLKKLMGEAQEDAPPSETNIVEAEKVLTGDALFRSVVVQRSRAYVKESQLKQTGNAACFPTRLPPVVAEYSAKKTYERLLALVDQAFDKKKELFVLGIYFPLAYYIGPKEIDPYEKNRQRQVVALIRTQFLKRFESSALAFERSCERLLLRLLAWTTRHSETDQEKRNLERWRLQHGELLEFTHQREHEWAEEEEEADEDIITEEMLEEVKYLPRDEYDVPKILADTVLDLDQVAIFMDELRKFQAKHDDKLKALVKLLKSDPVLKKHKVLIFSEYAETARYLRKQLTEAGIKGVDQVDSTTKRDRSEIIHRFAPYYNGSSSGELAAAGVDEIRVLISTDILAEGLNLQDATRLINYDLHWNPVKLMQRIGRVDRRMNPEVEERLIADHPDQQELRGKIVYWNFLPPGEIEDLLRLYNRVSHKTLRISKTFGIEGKKLLRPDDDYDALREFNEEYEGTKTPVEQMHLEYQQLLKDHPDLAARLDALPGRVFSGKEAPAGRLSPGTQAVFFCYRLPKPDYSVPTTDGNLEWTEAAGETRWLLYDLAGDAILDDPPQIIEFIRSAPDTPRHCVMEHKTLAEVRGKVEKHIKNGYLRSVQAPVGVRPILKAWMELTS